MLFSNSYFTIRIAAHGLYKDKGSKFFAYAFQVLNEEDIKKQLATLRKEHPSAQHHCYAWRLGADKLAHRTNDDGEPANTAGKPIFSQIQSKDLTNVLIVVVRYFGGTLLGVNGLINAYKNAAASAIANCEIEERFIWFENRVDFNFEDMNFLMKALKDNDCKIISQDYAEVNQITFQIKRQNVEKFEKQISGLYKIKISYIRTL